MMLSSYNFFAKSELVGKNLTFITREKGLYEGYCPLTRTHVKYLERKIDRGDEAVNGVRMDCLSHRDICNANCDVLNLVYLSTRSRNSSNPRNR